VPFQNAIKQWTEKTGLSDWFQKEAWGGVVVKNLPANAGDVGDSGLIPGSGRSPGGGNGNLLQYSSQKNPKDRRD